MYNVGDWFKNCQRGLAYLAKRPGMFHSWQTQLESTHGQNLYESEQIVFAMTKNNTHSM